MEGVVLVQEYRIPVDSLINVLSFLSYQHQQQVSRVSRDASISSEFLKEKSDRAATVIQRAFRRWKVMLRFAMSIEKTTERCQLPERWQKYFQTKMGKDFGKRLFMSYYYKFLYRIKGDKMVRTAVDKMVDGFFYCEYPNTTDTTKLLDLQRNMMLSSANPQIYLLTLIKGILFPYIDREGAEVVFHTRKFFGNNTPPVWSKAAPVDWFGPRDWLADVFRQERLPSAFDL